MIPPSELQELELYLKNDEEEVKVVSYTSLREAFNSYYIQEKSGFQFYLNSDDLSHFDPQLCNPISSFVML